MHKALALGYPLAALRSIGASLITSSNTYFVESRLFAAARKDPDLFAPEAARRDLAQLRRDRRAARPAHDSTRAALMRDASLRPWRDGAHVEAVAGFHHAVYHRYYYVDKDTGRWSWEPSFEPHVMESIMKEKYDPSCEGINAANLFSKVTGRTVEAYKKRASDDERDYYKKKAKLVRDQVIKVKDVTPFTQ